MHGLEADYIRAVNELARTMEQVSTDLQSARKQAYQQTYLYYDNKMAPSVPPTGQNYIPLPVITKNKVKLKNIISWGTTGYYVVTIGTRQFWFVGNNGETNTLDVDGVYFDQFDTPTIQGSSTMYTITPVSGTFFLELTGEEIPYAGSEGP